MNSGEWQSLMCRMVWGEGAWWRRARRPGLQASIRDHESVIPALRAPVHLLKIEIIITSLDSLPELCKLIGLVWERTTKTLKNCAKESLCSFIDRKHYGNPQEESTRSQRKKDMFPWEGDSHGKTGRTGVGILLKIAKRIKHLLGVRYNAFLGVTLTTTSLSSYRWGNQGPEMLRNLPKLTELARGQNWGSNLDPPDPRTHALFPHPTERSGNGDRLADWRVRRQRDKMKKKVRARLQRVLSVHCGKRHRKREKHDGNFLLGRMTWQ